jgi:flagellar hook protein FlgE
MMRSLYSAVSGLRIHQTKMDVIANNIANVNTTGFKASRVTFNDMFSQKLTGASSASAETGRGGTNAMQIGLGASLASIDKLMTRGAAQITDGMLDAMIDGDGFFIVGDSSGDYFTRAGAFTTDGEGNLTMVSNGMIVKGWDASLKADGSYTVDKGIVGPLNIMGEGKATVPPKATTGIKYTGNLNFTDQEKSRTIDFYDSLGNLYVIDVQTVYVQDPLGVIPPYWSYQMGNMAYPNGDRAIDKAIKVVPGAVGAAGAPVTISLEQWLPTDAKIPGNFSEIKKLEFTKFGDIVPDNLAVTGTPPPKPSTDLVLQFVDNGNVLNPRAIIGGDVINPYDNSALAAVPPTLPNTGGDGYIVIDFNGLKQYDGDESNAKADKINGNKSGELINFSINQEGMIVGSYSNGQKRVLCQIPVAIFANPEGLERMGGSLFAATINSGRFDGVGQSVTSGGGSMKGGALEMANVDLAGEFTDMITTQRGFQANSRAITTSDDMLQELVNLKR